MNSRYQALCTVQVTHTYHEGPCPDLSFVVPAQTARALARARLILRSRPGQLFVVAETNDSGELRAPFSDLRILLGLRLTTPHFSNYTQTPAAWPLYSNDVDPLVLAAPVAAQLTGHLLHLPVADFVRPITVNFRPRQGPVYLSERLRVNDTRTVLDMDLRAYPEGQYILETRASGVVQTKPLVLDDELFASGVFGVLALNLDPSMMASPPSFNLPFVATEQRLSYYVVARNLSASEFGLLTVVDAGAVEEGRTPVVFERVESTAFTPAELPAELLRGADEQVVLFRSTVALPRRARGLRRLQLHRNGDVLVVNLPQAHAESQSSDVIVRVSKP